MAVKKAVQQPAFDQAKLYLWVKGLEGKINNLLREVDLLKNDFIKKQSSIKKDVKTVSDDLLEIKHQFTATTQKMDLIIKELKKTAGIEEVMTLKKYLEFWNPINFVSQRDLERAVQTALSEAANSRPKQEETGGKKVGVK